MTEPEPVAELDAQFSSPEATPTPWASAREQLEAEGLPEWSPVQL